MYWPEKGKVEVSISRQERKKREEQRFSVMRESFVREKIKSCTFC